MTPFPFIRADHALDRALTRGLDLCADDHARLAVAVAAGDAGATVGPAAFPLSAAVRLDLAGLVNLDTAHKPARAVATAKGRAFIQRTAL